MEARTKSVNGADIQGKKVKEEGTFSFRSNREHIAASIWMNTFKNVL